ncbi:MAG: alpha-amylase family glycosyl hydrolase [Cyclobacteriaceae bacterium]
MRITLHTLAMSMLLMFASQLLLAQAVSLNPAFPSLTEEVTITVDVSQATDSRAAGLRGLSSGVYLWSGAGTQDDAFIYQPSGQTDFSQPFPAGEMTFVETDKWEIKLVIKDYYNIPDGVTPEVLGLLLKNANGTAQTEDFVVSIVRSGEGAVSLSPEVPTLSDLLRITVDLKAVDDPRADGLLGLDSVYFWSGVGDTQQPFRYGPPGQDNFGAPFPAGLMTSVGDDVWQIDIQLNEFYSIGLDATVNRIGFLLKNASGTAQTEDFVFEIAPGGNFLAFISPRNLGQVQFIEQGASFPISFGTSAPGDLQLSINEGSGYQQVATVTADDSLIYNYTVNAGDTLLVKAEATINGQLISKEREIVFQLKEPRVEAALPAGIEPGINYDPADDTKVTLALLAPGKDFVYVVGEFTKWQIDEAYQMQYDPATETFWLEISGLEPGKEYIYQYWVDGVIKIGDPFADKVADPFNDPFIPASVYPNLPVYNDSEGNGIATVLQTGQQPFAWAESEASWQRPAEEDLIVYELLVRDFIGTHSYRDLTDTLSYLKRLGVNAIELMPIMEFEGNISWGYNPSYFFAPDKYYGTKNELKEFIQTAHQEGFAVILDMVLNHHFGQSPMVQMYFEDGRPTAENPWFNRDATHPFNVGYDMNHESPYTQEYVDRVNRYWIEEYHFDGYRFDLSKGFTQTNNPDDVGAWSAYDQSRIDILTRMAEQIWAVDPDTYVILEHFADGSEEQALAAEGMLLWGNYNFAFRDLLSGKNTSVNLNGLQRFSHVNYMESHDEERLVYETNEHGQSSNGYDISELTTGLNRSKLGAAFFFTIPGPKMLWQFQELGYDIDINLNGRTGEKPLVWGPNSLNYYGDAERMKVYDTYAAIIELTEEYEEVFTLENSEYKLDGSMKWIRYDGDEMDVVIVGNFGLTANEFSPGFTTTGTWYGYLTGDSLSVTDTQQTVSLQPGEFHILTTNKLEKPGEDLVPFQNEITSLLELPGGRELRLYPNPGADFAYLDGIKSGEQQELEVLNLFGQTVAVHTSRVDEDTLRIDLQTLRPGQYILRLKDTEQWRNMKLLVRP